METPKLFTFDVFGTVLDWRTGLERDCRAAGRPLVPGDFDRLIDRQAELEERPHLSYAEITRRSLVKVLGLSESAAARIGERVGEWPLYADSAEALRRLMRVAPCAALTNSDRAHGEQVQKQLGFRLSHWQCAEDVGFYKPDERVWRTMAERRGVAMDGRWWHVSAYADYDLAVANQLGLTTVYVARPHARPGAATLEVEDLAALAARWR